MVQSTGGFSAVPPATWTSLAVNTTEEKLSRYLNGKYEGSMPGTVPPDMAGARTRHGAGFHGKHFAGLIHEIAVRGRAMSPQVHSTLENCTDAVLPLSGKFTEARRSCEAPSDCSKLVFVQSTEEALASIRTHDPLAVAAPSYRHVTLRLIYAPSQQCLSHCIHLIIVGAVRKGSALLDEIFNPWRNLGMR